MTETQAKVIQWLARGEVGTSSQCMAMWLAFGERVPSPFPPSDSDDLRRCLWLLDWAPGLRSDLPKMAEVSDKWAALMSRWDEVEALYYTDRPKTNALLRDIIWPKAQGWLRLHENNVSAVAAKED